MVCAMHAYHAALQYRRVGTLRNIPAGTIVVLCQQFKCEWFMQIGTRSVALPENMFRMHEEEFKAEKIHGTVFLYSM